MNIDPQQRWCVFLCHDNLSIQHVLSQHNIQLSITAGDSLSSIFDSHSLDKYFSFVKKMKTQKSLFLQEMNVRDVQGECHLMDFSTIQYKDHYLVAGVSKEMEFHTELSVINQELNNTLRQKIKDALPSSEYMDQLSGLNNELINTKRELVKKNVEIQHLLHKEEALTWQLEELVRTKDLLFSIIAHDLRSPMANILNLMALLNMDEESYQEVMEQGLISTISESTSRALRLLEDLLKWYQYSQKEHHIFPQFFDAKELADQVVHLYGTEALQKQVSLSISTGGMVSPYGDPHMISTVLRNVVSNAIKFTPPNGRIDIRIEAEQNRCRFTVTDTGVGIPPEKLDTLFEIEKNKSTVGLSGERGNGFGLILARTMIEKNGGTIIARSTLGQGTEIAFTLPITETATET